MVPQVSRAEGVKDKEESVPPQKIRKKQKEDLVRTQGRLEPGRAQVATGDGSLAETRAPGIPPGGGTENPKVETRRTRRKVLASRVWGETRSAANWDRRLTTNATATPRVGSWEPKEGRRKENENCASLCCFQADDADGGGGHGRNKSKRRD